MAAKPKTARDRANHIPAADPGARMTGEQRALLRQLARDGFEPDAYSDRLTSAEAATRITMLRAKLRLLDEPPHTL